jgi:Alginate export
MLRFSAQIRWSWLLLLVVAVPALAQSHQAPTTGIPPITGNGVASASSTTASAPSPAKPTKRWGDALKNIPLAHRWPLTLSVGGQARWREESFRAFNVGALDDDHTQSRVALNADLLIGRRTGAFGRVLIEGRDAQSYGRNLPGGARPTDADRVDVQNLYVDVGYASSFLRVGRQEIALNRERLFGVPDWANTRRGSQGARLQLSHGRYALEAVDARPMLVRQSAPNRADSTARFRTLSLGSAAGAKPLLRGLPATWQAYWYEQTLRSATTVGSTTTTSLTRRLTTGSRLMWQRGTAKSATRSSSLEFEGALQRGHAGARELSGWFWVTEAQMQWKQQYGAPSLALGVEEASGERRATDNRQEAFAVLYPAAHAHGGYADVIGRSNVRELHAIATWDPVAPVRLRGAFYRFDRLRTDDGIYTKQNTVFRAASGSHARHAADEIDLTGTWKVSLHWQVIAGGAVVLPGRFLKDTPGSARTERWGFVGTTFTF